MAKNMAWGEDATMHLEIIRTQASSTIASLRSKVQDMTDSRTDAQVSSTATPSLDLRAFSFLFSSF
jgi:hypothetical protein